MSLKAQMLKMQMDLFMLESKQASEFLQVMMQEIKDHFLEHEPEIQEIIINALDEMAQEMVRKRDIFDTTLAELKSMQGEAHGG